nr:trypsin family serine protease [Frankliniella occidentalis]
MEFPWAVRLGYRSPYGGTAYQCGGALISSRYVITAAHCTEKSSPPVTVRLGEHDARTEVDCSILGNTSVCAPPAVDVRVEEVISHPEYVKSTRRRDGLWNDIALLRLARPVEFTRGVAPVCLPNDMPRGQAEKDQLMREQKGFTFTVVGWGRIGKDEDADVSDVLLKLNLQTMKHADCAAKYSRFPNKLNEELQMCGIAKNGQDVCSGDSGGPLTSVMSLSNRKVRSVLRGIVSFGPTVCASEGVPAIFTRVTHYLPWIMSTLRP